MVHHDDSLGLVLVDRNTVAIGLGDVTLSFGAYPAEARGVVRFMHPLHNFAILSYDTTDLNAKVSSSNRRMRHMQSKSGHDSGILLLPIPISQEMPKQH